MPRGYVGAALAGLMVLAACSNAAEAPPAGPSAQKTDPVSLLRHAHKTQNGGAIALPPGYYPPLVVSKMKFKTPVTLDGGGLVIFERIELDRVSGITFRNVIVEGGAIELQDRDYAVNIMNSRDIHFANSRIGWSKDQNPMNDAMGVNIRASQRVSVQDTIIHDSFIGLVVRDSDDVSVQKNLFRDIRRDGMNVSGSVNVSLENNTCTEFHPTRPLDHPDCIQLWNDTAVRSNENIRIVSNKVLRGQGGVSQGIFLSGQKPGLPHRRVLIEGNLIHQGMGQGIFVHKTEEAIIRNNKTMAAEPVEFVPGLTIRPPVSGIVASDNVVSQLEIKPELISSGNVIARNNIVRTVIDQRAD